MNLMRLFWLVTHVGGIALAFWHDKLTGWAVVCIILNHHSQMAVMSHHLAKLRSQFAEKRFRKFSQKEMDNRAWLKSAYPDEMCFTCGKSWRKHEMPNGSSGDTVCPEELV